MEPINYRRAIVRRWPLIAVIAIVCAVVGVLLPIHAPNPAPKTQWQATALAGVPPPKTSTTAQAAASLDTVKYYAEQEGPYTNTAKALHLKKSDGFALRKDIQIKAKASLPPGSADVLAKQPTKNGAAKLANTFVKQLAAYVNAQLASQYKTQLSQAQNDVNTLQTELASVVTQINTLTKASNKPPKTTPTTTTTTPTTTTTTVPKATTTSVARTTTTTVAPTTTTVARTTTTTTKKAGPVTTTTPTTSAVPTTTPVTAALVSEQELADFAGSSFGQSLRTEGRATLLAADSAVLDKPHPTTTTTTKPKTTKPTGTTEPPSQLSLLQERQKTLTALLGSAITRLQHLQNEPTPTSGFVLLQAARESQAKLIPTSLNPFVHRPIRAGAGFVGGLILGALIALLLDGFDRRLRTATRARDVFGLPVIAEIPRQIEPRTPTEPGGRSRRNTPRSGRPGTQRAGRGTAQPDESVALQPIATTVSVAVVDAPASVVAEAYRRLRVSVMFAPLARANRVGSSDAVDSSDGYGQFGPGNNDNGGSWTDGRDRDPQRGRHAGSNAERDVIMVTSPGPEQSTREVVLNLAAAYAEAGERVLVVSTADLRSNGQFAPVPDPSWSPPPTEPVRPVHAGAVQVQAGGIPDAPTQQIPPAPLAPPVRLEEGSRGPARQVVTPEEVVARCIPQRISGVSKLELATLLRGPGELATRGDAVITTARQVADVVIVEAPAVLGATDAEALVRSVDAVLVVAQCYMTTVSQARRSGELLRGVGSPTLGVVLTDVLMTRKERRAMLAGLPGRP